MVCTVLLVHPPTNRTSALRSEVPLLLAVVFVGTDFVASKYALEGFRPMALVAAPNVRILRKG